MKTAKRIRSSLIISGIAVIAILAIGTIVTFTKLPTVTGVLSNVETATFVIYKDATLTYAKNGTSGEISFNDASSATVIQKAINALPSKGGKISIKTGNYTITSSIMLNKTGVIFEGEGLSSTVLKGQGDIKVIRLDSPTGKNQLDDVSIRDLSLEGESISIGDDLISTADISSTEVVTKLVIRDVQFKFIKTAAANLRNSDAVIIDRVKVGPNFKDGAVGLQFISDSHATGGIRIENSAFAAGDCSAPPCKITLLKFDRISEQIKRVHIAFNSFHTLNATRPITGINVTAGAGSDNFQAFEIISNTFESVNSPIHMNSNGAKVEESSILANHFFNTKNDLELGPAQKFIHLGSGTEEIKVAFNDFHGGVTNTLTKGIMDDNTANKPNIIMNNQFSNIATNNQVILATNAKTIGSDFHNLRLTNATLTADPSLAILTALGATIPDTNGAAKTKVSGINFVYWVLDFDQTTQETVYYTFEVPPDMNKEVSMTVKVRFIASTATGGVCFSGAFRGVVNNELWDGTFTSTQTGCNTSLNTQDRINEVSITFTTAQHGLEGGDTVQFKLQRDPNHSSDTMGADARVIDTRVLWN